MEESKTIVEDLMNEHDKFMRYAEQLDPLSNEYRELKKTITQNAKDIVDIEHEEQKIKIEAEEVELKKKELDDAKADRRTKLALAGIAGVVGIVSIIIQAKCNDHSVDRIYGYETEAIMPQNKLNMVMNKPPKIPILK